MSAKAGRGRGPARSQRADRPRRPPADRSAPTRRAQRAAEQRRRQRRQRMARTGLVVAGFAALVAVAVWLLVGGGGGGGGGGERTGGAGEPEGVRSFEVASRSHVNGDVDYPQTPPVGGDHAPVWQNCGFYAEPILPTLGVHSMEHGAVWITYSPDLPAEQVAALRQRAGRETFVLVSRWFEALPSPVVASAWGRQSVFSSASDPRLDDFVRTFRQGSQAPEPGAPCTGGQGTPA